MELCAYSNVDYGSDPTDRKSVTSFYIIFGDYLISWKTKKQSIVSLSSTEAEYRVMASMGIFLWLRWLLVNMGIFLPHPTPIYCDNKSAIQITHNYFFFYEQTKHINIDCHITHHHLK